MPAPALRAYPKATVVAEKLHAVTILGMTNSRMTDFFDLWVLLHDTTLEDAVLGHAIEATFARRQTTIPNALPIGLSDAFATDPTKQIQWRAFLRKRLIVSGLGSATAPGVTSKWFVKMRSLDLAWSCAATCSCRVIKAQVWVAGSLAGSDGLPRKFPQIINDLEPIPSFRCRTSSEQEPGPGPFGQHRQLPSPAGGAAAAGKDSGRRPQSAPPGLSRDHHAMQHRLRAAKLEAALLD